MSHWPSFADFEELAKGQTVVPVYRQLTSDVLTPTSAFCKIQEGEWSFLFESVVGGERLGRYSFIGSNPNRQLLSWGGQVEIRAGAVTLHQRVNDPLACFAEQMQPYRAAHGPGLPRFCGGAVGFAGYDIVRHYEPLHHPPPDDRQIPDLCFGWFDRMVIFDHIKKTILVVAYAYLSSVSTLREAYEQAKGRVDEWVEKLQRRAVDLPIVDVALPTDRQLFVDQPRWQSNFSRAAFESAVARCLEYIRAGDIFQVVLSQRFQTETRANSFAIYRALRVINPSPFMFYLRCGPVTLIGSSPEILARVENGLVTVRPLAGTRPRGATEEEDRQLAVELLSNPKERAEHIMLVDLGRNDVGRVAEFGSVQLNDLMTIERYSHVMHLSSTVRGRLKAGYSALDALRVCLPAGTLSGAPKVRAMQIIDELEPCRRGPYGGAVGYLDFTGNMDTCIALRTIVMLGQTAYLQAGAGIVADSVPSEEYLETVHKAQGLVRALQIAEEQL
jgi:anthranilate synthase component 1